MTEIDAKLLVDCACDLGEGIQWNADHQRIFWTDIHDQRPYSCDETGRSLETLTLDGNLCAFAFDTPERLLAAFADGLYWLDLNSGKRELIRAYMADQPTTRMNDGGLDRQGRFVVGGYEKSDMAPITPVWQVAADNPVELFTGVGCANSIAFSPDGTRMYFADTAGLDIYVFDYDTKTGRPHNKRVFANIGAEFGHPDGSTVDADGGLWNARFGGARVQRFHPSGVADLAVNLPVPNVTCCTIGGAALDRMFITTARILMSPAELADKPNAGGVFCAEIPHCGLPSGRYGG